MTVMLAEADLVSRELGLQPRKGYTDYTDENHRRCLKWLEGVQVVTAMHIMAERHSFA